MSSKIKVLRDSIRSESKIQIILIINTIIIRLALNIMSRCCVLFVLFVDNLNCNINKYSLEHYRFLNLLFFELYQIVEHILPFNIL
jgi:hypothetical protein